MPSNRSRPCFWGVPKRHSLTTIQMDTAFALPSKPKSSKPRWLGRLLVQCARVGYRPGRLYELLGWKKRCLCAVFRSCREGCVSSFFAKACWIYEIQRSGFCWGRCMFCPKQFTVRGLASSGISALKCWIVSTLSRFGVRSRKPKWR